MPIMNLLISAACDNLKKHQLKLQKMGFNIFFLENEYDALPIDNKLVDVVVCNNLFSYHDISTFSQLKYIQLTSVGTDRVPLEHIQKNKIILNNAKGVYSVPISEYVISGIFFFYKKMNFFIDNKHNKEWIKDREILELHNKKAMIFGAGNIGEECAKKLKAFGCKVFGVDLSNKTSKYFTYIFDVHDFYDELLNDIDIVIVTLPLTTLTFHFFDSRFFSKMKKNSLFVNVSRGKLVVENDLIDALDKNIGGAILDVFDEEPLDKDSPLWKYSNVFITPHNSFVGDGNDRRLSSLIIDNLKDFIS